MSMGFVWELRLSICLLVLSLLPCPSALQFGRVKFGVTKGACLVSAAPRC